MFSFFLGLPQCVTRQENSKKSLLPLSFGELSFRQGDSSVEALRASGAPKSLSNRMDTGWYHNQSHREGRKEGSENTGNTAMATHAGRWRNAMVKSNGRFPPRRVRYRSIDRGSGPGQAKISPQNRHLTARPAAILSPLFLVRACIARRYHAGPFRGPNQAPLIRCRRQTVRRRFECCL